MDRAFSEALLPPCMMEKEADEFSVKEFPAEAAWAADSAGPHPAAAALCCPALSAAPEQLFQSNPQRSSVSCSYISVSSPDLTLKCAAWGSEQ